MSKISVLIPTHKPGGYISACLNSINCQTLGKESFKVYIALNGSEDCFFFYLKEVLEKSCFEFELFNLPESGVSMARNFLIENSKEDYIVFIDDDDVISENYLEGLLAKSSDEAMGIANSYNFESDLGDLKENYIGKCFERLPEVTCSKYKSRKYFSSPCAKLIHRNMIGETRFDENLKIGEDSLFMAKISNKIKRVVKADRDVCYYVYERMGSVTRRGVKKKNEINRILYLLREYLKMLFSMEYNLLFIVSRIVATLIHGKKLII
ncbi:glycosyltransferase [Alcaligenes faecalis]|uniref:glycosyltransferase n=1 Tax=Alcaligenes faecalis TaxID=511 RepID=UPI0029336ECE|nr:glycosyltransferase family 2 protein [Alcaligenes faecalis]MDV2114809.1 glycosyltransferase family 2 protein [Alcaligenes faecalis]